MDFPELYLDSGEAYFEVMNDKQREFHASPAKFRWLGGGMGGGKSIAAIAEGIRHSWYYPNNLGFILRKTFPELKSSAIKDFHTIVPEWMVYSENQNDHTVKLLNYIGYDFMYNRGGKDMRKTIQARELKRIRGLSEIQFISFEGTVEAERKFRSANLGWYFIEQAEEASIHVYDALNSRLRRKLSARQAWFVSNPEGRDWLWYIFHKDSPDRRENHHHIPVELEDNPGLTPDYHETLKDTYTEEDYQRFVKGSHDVSVDAVFPEFSHMQHVIDHFEPPEDWKKGIGLDVGISNPTAYVLAAKFPKPHDNIYYIYHEYEEKNRTVAENAHSLYPLLTPAFECFAIDPESKKRDRVHADTVIGEYNNLGIPFQASSRDRIAGINRMKEYLRYDEFLRNPITNRLGSVRMLISNRCTKLIEQLLQYRFKEQKTGRGFQNPPDEFRDYKDHLVAATRYLWVKWTHALSVKSYIKEFEEPALQSFTPRNRQMQEMLEIFDADHNLNFQKLIADSNKIKGTRRTTTWVA